ncbi:MAG: repressor LexA [Elusimicrobia bacterium RIFOXYA2_FULL_39_19]|nr:MAG: repressor LexA [Elusimicrobia bacterium RIFOXYA2_FULL_39_19]
MKKISGTTKRVLDTINQWFKTRHYPPTLRELAQTLNFSSTWPVRYHINKLIELGYLKMDKKISRGLGLTQKNTGIPVLGRVSAGLPVDAVENIEEHIDLSAEFKKENGIFALKVKGDSMKDAGILEGDTVFVRKQPTAANGDIVVALIGDEALVKKYFITPQGIKLVAANPKYKPLVSKEAVILGKVISVLRKYNK